MACIDWVECLLPSLQPPSSPFRSVDKVVFPTNKHVSRMNPPLHYADSLLPGIDLSERVPALLGLPTATLTYCSAHHFDRGSSLFQVSVAINPSRAVEEITAATHKLL
jgi:hypothetical protein